MSIFSDPPEARTFRQDNAVLLVCWWCTILSMFIILFRVCGRYIRSEKLFREDWIAFVCIIPLLCRMATVHVVLYFGTNNVQLSGLSEVQIHRRSIGSRVVLVSRVLNAATLWMLKLTITEFFKRLIWNISASSHEKNLRGIRWILLITFLSVIIADVSECRPFFKYWQVVPDPGSHCRQGYAQLLTFGVMSVLTDLLLAIFPVPIIIKSKMSLKRKIQLILLFFLSSLPAGVTIYRLPRIISNQGSQHYRSLLASVEILIAAICANALILGSFVRDRGVKKAKFKVTSTATSVEPDESVRGKFVRAWGSDIDLVRDLGLSVNPGHSSPIIDPTLIEVAPTEKWHFPLGKRKFSEEFDLLKLEQQLGTRKGSIATRKGSVATRKGSVATRKESTATRKESTATRKESIVIRKESIVMRNESIATINDISGSIPKRGHHRRVSFADVDEINGAFPLRRGSQRTLCSDAHSSTFDPVSSSGDLETGLYHQPMRKMHPALLNDHGGLQKLRGKTSTPTEFSELRKLS